MENILINESIEKINDLSNEKNKDIFIKNYELIKKDIENIDMILDKDNEFIKSKLSIEKLFEMLESYKEIINNPNELNIIIFKKIMDLIEIIENKLEKSNLDIKKID